MAKKSPFSSKTEEYPERCEAKADGLLLDFCRFIRLQAAQDAWLRRLTRQHTMAFLGRGFFLFRVIFFCACVLDSISGVFRCFWDVFWDIIFGCLLECLFVFLGWGGIEKSLVSFGLILYGFVQCPNQHLRTEHLRLAMAIPALRHRSCLFPGPKEPEIDCDMWFLLIVVKDTLRPTKWLELRKQPRLFQVGFSDSLGNCAENLDAGRSLVDLDFSREGDGEQQFCTPFFARPGGSLHLGACYSVVPENPGHKDSKLLEFCEFLDGFGGFWWISAAGGWIWMVSECFWLFLILSLWFLIVFAWKNNAKRWWNHFVWAVQSKYVLDLLARWWCYMIIDL